MWANVASISSFQLILSSCRHNWRRLWEGLLSTLKSLLTMANPRRSGSLESVGSQHREHFVNLERRRDRHMTYTHSERAPFVHSVWTGQHQASHNSHDKEVYNLKKKVDRLRQHLHHKARVREERTLTPSQSSSSEDYRNYRQRSRTPSSESSSRHHDTLQVKGTIARGPRPRQGKVRQMTPWEKRSSRYPVLPFLGILSRPNSPVASIN